jgi:diguanylate cyclase (GGDEF)-like protein/PAS domain S-box-containing protein
MLTIREKRHPIMINNLDLKSVLDNMDTGVILVNDQEKIIHINNLLTEITGYTKDELSNLSDCFKVAFRDAKKRENIKEIFDFNLREDKIFEGIFKIETKSGQLKDLKFKANKLPNDYLVVNVVDVSDDISRKKEIKIIKDRLKIAVEAANIGIWDWYMQTDDCYYNKNWAEMLGYKLEDLEQKPHTWESLVHSDDKDKVAEKMNKHFEGLNDIYSSEHRLRTKSGEYIWVKDIGKVVETDENGNILRATGVHLNIDQYKKRQQQIEFLSFHDELTGLYNRRYLQNEIKRLNNSRKYPISIIVGDLDNLKEVNDSFGHGIGDQYLKKTAGLLKEVLRSEDIIARTGGDEFVILLLQTNKFTAKKICYRIKEEFAKYNKQKCLLKDLSISLGSSTAESSTDNLNIAYEQADKKMYINKRSKANIK